ncbi:glutamate--tRNA ligase [Candidatus Parcubacteria bacterium]|nr:glutamate--tRNA ligase [Patescibacteria group bacterium]MBU4466471.1 glutamate--tRNA ligase [Patescibacteria group bacterium]MCG2688547.1 glutamate--tRNA ligase [Candidatus Parcubacteria bacterium]
MESSTSKKEEIRTRFAPSPTGFLQLGNLRTALFTYLFAKKNNGVFILRIEDTDKERSKPEYEKAILETLKWTGLLWDEGPEADGDYGPYRQSEKLDVYEKYLKQLLNEDKAFYCFCSEEEIETYRQYRLSQGQSAAYSGKCREITLSQAQQKLSKGEKAIIRFKNKIAEPVIFNDLIRGKTEFDPHLIGDFSIARDLRSPLYNFSCVIDDFDMKITHVIRGEDHISNTPKQIMLQKAFAFTSPKYAHLPMILAPDRSKLSKRHGAVSALTYRDEGYLPEALINFLVLLGWHPEDDREIFALKGLIKEFSLERVQKSGAIFNQQRLDWLNGFYLRNLSLENLTGKCLPFLIQSGLIKVSQESVPVQLIPVAIEVPWKEQEYKIVKTKEIINFDYLKKIVSLYQQRLKKLSEIIELVNFFFEEKIIFSIDLLKWKEMTDEEIKECLEVLEKILREVSPENWQKENLENILLPEAEKIRPKVQQADFGVKDRGDRGYLLWPLRVALSGKQFSAGPFEIADVLGKDKTIKRIQQAIKII